MEGTEPLQNRAPILHAAAGAVDEVDLIPVRTYWQLVRRRFMQHRLAVVALVMLGVLVGLAFSIPTLTGDLYQKTSLELISAPASLAAPLGYDRLGENIFIRLMRGTQTSLTIGFAAVLIIVGIGVTFGAIAGYLGGWADNLLMRVVDIVLSIPTLFLIITLVAFWGSGNMWVIIFAIGLAGWTTAARLVRAEFLRLREVDFVQAARALGASPRRIIMRHMLPMALAPILVAATLGIADSVVLEAALSFLGFGISPPEASLGNMLTNAQQYFYREPILMFYPGIMLILVVLCASFLGDGLRDALDPRQRIGQ
jgi:peptide/nickel transport system permease protein